MFAGLENHWAVELGAPGGTSEVSWESLLATGQVSSTVILAIFEQDELDCAL